jgi:hypothetical protein
MIVNSFYETLFVRLSENRHGIRNLIIQVKRELIAADCSTDEASG